MSIDPSQQHPADEPLPEEWSAINAPEPAGSYASKTRLKRTGVPRIPHNRNGDVKISNNWSPSTVVHVVDDHVVPGLD